MKFVSTRGKAPAVNFVTAISQGLAPDGGLYVPEKFPTLSSEIHRSPNVGALAVELLSAFSDGELDPKAIEHICEQTFSFPIPVSTLEEKISMLELFHGPTAAFKDFGARFLAEILSLPQFKSETPLRTVVVATSGDTGGAVACAFDRRPGFEVLLLYPRGMVSELQERQLTTWSENVHAFRVHGNFDDCQRIAKEAFLSPHWAKEKNLASANSINLGRLLPQMIYYAWASLQASHKGKAHWIIPAGNLGNSLAAFWARQLGFPIGRIVLATNANRVVPDFYSTGKFEPAPTVRTLANAMDVGNPSNWERLKTLTQNSEAHSVSDSEILSTIREAWTRWNRLICPHTATAAHLVLHKVPHQDHSVIVATAHPAKFEEVLNQAFSGKTPRHEQPPSLKALEGKTQRVKDIGPTLNDLERAIDLKI